MKTKVSLSNIVTILAFVFVLIVGVVGTNAWLSYSPEKTGVVVTIGTVDATITGNSTQGSALYVDLATTGFQLPTNLAPGSFTQNIRAENNDTSAIYVRIRWEVRVNGQDATASNYITPTVLSGWTSNSGWYVRNSTIAAGGDADFCNTMTVSSSLPQAALVQMIIIMEASSTAF